MAGRGAPPCPLARRCGLGGGTSRLATIPLPLLGLPARLLACLPASFPLSRRRLESPVSVDLRIRRIPISGPAGCEFI